MIRRLTNGTALQMAIAAAITAVLSGPAAATAGASGWQLVYRNGPDGEPLAGSKSQLIDAIRRGLPIRFGWGLQAPSSGRSVEHVDEPSWIEILDGKEVIVQLDGLTQRRFTRNPIDSDFADPKIRWLGILSTSGALKAVWINRATGETAETHPPQRVTVSWYAEMPVGDPSPPARPLWETAPAKP